MRQQEEALKNFRDPFKQDEAIRSGRTSMQAPGNLQSADGKAGPFPGNVQGGQAAQQAGNRTPVKPS